MKPGIYDVPAVRYYGDDLADVPTLNPTVAKLLVGESARHAWNAHPKLNPDYRAVADRKFDVGSAAHEVYLLGGEDRIAVVEAADWRSKAAQAVRDQAREEGMIPLLADEWRRVTEMLNALRAQIPLIDADPPLFTAGKPEQTAVWEDHGVLCRCRIDWLHDDMSAIDDMKTTVRSANPVTWTRTTLWGIGGDIQCVMNRRAIRALTGIEPAFRFVVAESRPPYVVTPVDLAPSALELAETKVDAALEKWKRCLDSGDWPAYTRRVVSAEAPAWLEGQWWEMQQLDEEEAAA